MELNGPARTLLLTLRARAAETDLFTDATAAAWADHLPWPDDLAALLTPGFQTGFVVRTRLYDDALRAWATQQTQRPLIIELGGGLTTRPYRLADLNADWLITDLPEAIALRHRLEPDRDGITTTVIDLLEPGWAAALPQREAVAVVAEGVFLFLPAEAVQRVLVDLQARLPAARLLFDAAGHSLRHHREGAFAAVGAPIGWTVSDEGDLTGLDVLAVWPALHAFPQRWGDLLPDPVPEHLRSNSLVIMAAFR